VSTAVRLTLALAVIAAVVVAAFTSWRAPDVAAISGYAQTVSGPCGPADADLLVKVKQAGLWEMPAGQALADNAKDPKVREIGKKINAEHMELDKLTDQAAAEVNVPLPTEATLEQQDWVKQIQNAAVPDAIGVNLLRQAHGKILPIIAAVKVGTRNSTIRDFANTGYTYVSRHIGYLESTGLVDYTALPEPPAPVASLSPIKATYYQAQNRPTLAFAALAIALLGLVLVARILTRPDRRRPVPHHSRHRR
jgi:predicted outer membrane protein